MKGITANIRITNSLFLNIIGNVELTHNHNNFDKYSEIANYMKPIKNKVFCKDCGRTKMLFETEKKAENFIRFNKEEIETESGYGPQRCYYCLFCGGWHTTSIKEKIGLSKNEQLLEQFKEEKEKKMVTQKENSTKKNVAEEQNNKIKDLESQIKEMEPSQKEKFLSDSINNLNNEIDHILNSSDDTNKKKLKELRQNLAIHFVVRNQNGFTKANKRHQEAKEKEMEEWLIWAKKRGY